MKIGGFLLAGILCLAAVGCVNEQPTATKEQEQAFRNPTKEIPPDIAARMAKSREEAMKLARERQQRAGPTKG